MKRRILLAATAVLALLLLLFSAPAMATHVQCGDTITVDTVLDSDVVFPDTANVGLVMNTSDVTLWLARHTVRKGSPTSSPSSGIGVEGGFGDLVPPVSGVQIRGGSIEGFSSGVFLEGSNNSVLGLRVSRADAGIELIGNDNQAILNTIDVSHPMFSVGVRVKGDNAYVTRNTVRGGAIAGILAEGSNSRIVVNTVDPGGEGIHATGYAGAAGSTPPVVIARNRVSGCARGGIGVYHLGDTPGGAHVRRNEVTGCQYGIEVQDPAAFVWRNTANTNFLDGIRIWGPESPPGVTVQENTANNNGQYGIYALPNTIDGGGNTATGNGTVFGTANCVNVSCGP